MAVAYKEEALPEVSMLSFDINRWAGVNKIKGGQADYEMADCVNMSSDNYPYASPRGSHEKLVDEQGIKRIYKVENDRIYYIDSEDCLCYAENGVKSYVVDDDDNKIQMYNVSCTNNYDESSIFYPYMNYTDHNNSVAGLEYPLTFGSLYGIESIDDDDMDFYDELSEYTSKYTNYYTIHRSTEFYVDNISVREIGVKMTLPEASKYELPYTTGTTYPKLVLRVYDRDGNTKKYTDEDGTEHLVIQTTISIDDRENSYTITIPDSLEFEEGDYCLLRVGYFFQNNIWSTEMKSNMSYLFKGSWELTRTDSNEIATGPVLDYGIVYNNRVVGVRKNNIRASALGDFSNFWEYADEAGNPSSTGAYATDVGSAGEFTGICAYNNVILLFKRDIVYEMYGSMPYTITELCRTGCIDNDSICSIDGTLYWASPKGIVRYSGGVPVVISKQTDIQTDGICKAGTDGRKYYVYDGLKTYVYDTLYQMWHIYDYENVKMMYNHITSLYTLQEDGIYMENSGDEAVDWEFTTKDYTFSSKERKNLSKLWIRADMPKNTRLEIYVRQNGGEWSRAAVKTAENDEMFDFKLRIKKCDSYTLKFKGRGDVRILDIHGKVTVGTSKHRAGSSLNVYRK